MASDGKPNSGSGGKPPRSGGSQGGSGGAGRSSGGKNYGNKPGSGGKSYGDKPSGGRGGGKSYGDKPAGANRYGDKPSGGRPGSGRPSSGGTGSGAPRGGTLRGGRPVRSGSGDHKQYGERGARPERKEALDVPEIPEEIEYGQLDKQVRSRLRTLSKENAEDVGRHLIMAGLLVDSDPELAYRHAMVASARGGRVDVVREAAALTAYATGRYAEALREFRTVRRLSGSSEHLALMADCERGLGRPERAIALSQEPEASQLDATGAVEMAIVVAGARADMGDHEAALAVLNRLDIKDPAIVARVSEAKADVLRTLGRDAEADALARTLPVPEEPEEEDVVVFDTAEVEIEAPVAATSESGEPPAEGDHS